MFLTLYLTLLIAGGFLARVSCVVNAGPYQIGNSCPFDEDADKSQADFLIDSVAYMRALINTKVLPDLRRRRPSDAFKTFFTTKENVARVTKMFQSIYDGNPILDKITMKLTPITLQCIPSPYLEPENNEAWDCAENYGKAAYTLAGDFHNIYLCPLAFDQPLKVNPAYCAPWSRITWLGQFGPAMLLHEFVHIYSKKDDMGAQKCPAIAMTRPNIPTTSVSDSGSCVPEPYNVETLTKLPPEEQVQTPHSYALYLSGQ